MCIRDSVISWASAGELGFKGSRKSTPFAAGEAAETAAKAAMEHGLKSVEVYVKGPGSGREAAIRSLQTAGLEISMIKDCLLYTSLRWVLWKCRVYDTAHNTKLKK